MAATRSTLQDLILQFEVPLPDREFPDLVASLGEHARHRAATTEDNANYFYLLARVYELLGYCARHTPWLSNSPKFYWQKAHEFIEQAMILAPIDSPHRVFLNGKLLLRDAMIFTLDAKSGDPRNSQELLTKAETMFNDAASRETRPALRYSYLDARTIARTELRQRTLRQELKALTNRGLKAWSPAALKAVQEKLKEFPSDAFWEFPSAAAGMPWPTQHALARARVLFARAHMLEDFTAFLRDAQKKYGQDHTKLIAEQDATILAGYDQSAQLCDDVGLIVRAAHTRVMKVRRSADAALRECVYEFTTVRKSDAEERMDLLDRAGPPRRLLPKDTLPILATVRPDHDRMTIPAELLQAFHEAGVRIKAGAAVVAETESSWVVSDGFDRYLLQSTNSYPEVIDLTKQPVAFSHAEAQIFKKYSDRVTQTCELYTEAIREIHRALGGAGKMYERMTQQLELDSRVVASDANLVSLHVTTSLILKELQSRNYPLLSTLRDRTRYAWSLLEMFQMRNGSVRLGTLFSGQCRLIMRNPTYDPAVDFVEDEFLEVGADPIFQTTVDFIFRGAKGEENRHDFQRRALKATRTTINQQEQTVLIESRYLDFDDDTRRALIARLACHRSLALALDQFTPIFVAQRAGELATATIKRYMKDISNHFNDAVASLEAAAKQPSQLIDRPGLDALHDYMKGIAQVLIGMNQQEERNRAWVATYRSALELLERAQKELSEAGDVYLLPQGVIREEYLHYVEARILTVAGFRARYHEDYEQSAGLFEKSAVIFESLHDYRVATKARARATESKSYAEDAHEARYRRLKEANAMYAACGDALGYKTTSDRLQSDFPFEEASGTTAKIVAELTHPLPPPLPPPEELTVFGPFRNMTLIDVGGMGEIYRATRGQQVVALKRLQDAFLRERNKEVIARFMREADTIRSLDHPNIVRVLESDIIDGVPYYTMEFLEGRTLKASIDTAERYTPRAAAVIAKEVALALEHSHERGIIHRDLKPGNVMILADGQIKIMDFGIAHNRDLSGITQPDSFIGTLEYAAPQQIESVQATESNDLYAVGVILYEMLTGTRAPNIWARLKAEHPSPSRIVPDTPPALDRIVAKLLARSPDDRYPNATDLIKDLVVFLDEEQ